MVALQERARIVLDTYRVRNVPLFLVGTFDKGVTVYSQQSRALNLVWALIETKNIPCLVDPKNTSPARPVKIAIVGGGFAGLSVAAGLMKKRALADITIFEERDTLLPLQQGSDTRWLHPRIYDWPAKGSDANVAMLPVLNWSAARASDVVVQILSEWKNVVDEWTDFVARACTGQTALITQKLYCNSRHLQIHADKKDLDQIQIEWIGELRNVTDANTVDYQRGAVGSAEKFDIVILTVGYGLERDDAISYWRNETLGQPSLDQPQRAYLVSGQGDGAMIDLLRLRISQYRQDRILEELFHGRTNLNEAIRILYQRFSRRKANTGLFDELEKLGLNPKTKDDFIAVQKDLAKRLRRDTEVVLHWKVRKLSELFDERDTRISFQNRLLVFLLYKCGGFFPSAESETTLVERLSIAPSCVVRRHGPEPMKQLQGILATKLSSEIKKRSAASLGFSQSDKQEWPGGYFGFPGRLDETSNIADEFKKIWRKEYLPGAMVLLATSLCASLAGELKAGHAERKLRVTLHRALKFPNDELLQQACDYQGVEGAGVGTEGTAGRTFPAKNATIGLAYRCRRIVRSVRDVEATKLREAMNLLHIHAASSSMSADVGFVLAIPIIEPEEALRFTEPSPVAGVIYIDSATQGFYIDDQELGRLVSMTQHLVNGLEKIPAAAFDRIRNVPLSGTGNKLPKAEDLPNNVRNELELVTAVNPPRTSKPFQFNYDYSDFVPIQGWTQ
jgi:hypothetical protein